MEFDTSAAQFVAYIFLVVVFGCAGRQSLGLSFVSTNPSVLFHLHHRLTGCRDSGLDVSFCADRLLCRQSIATISFYNTC